MIENQTQYMDHKCIKFVERTNQTNWVKIGSAGYCYAEIGMQKRADSQGMFLGKDNCFNKETITHELLHSLGFFHEHSRPDRDQWIKVEYENVDESIIMNISLEILYHEA